MDYNRIAQIIAQRVKAEYSEDIAAVVIYGPAARGETQNATDLHFYFIPNTERGKTLGKAFMIKGCGFDFQPYSFEELSALREGDRQNVCMLLDAKLIFALNAEVVGRFEALRQRAAADLPTKERLSGLLCDCKALYFQFSDPNTDAAVLAVEILQKISCTLLFANASYLSSGLSGMKAQVLSFKKAPACYRTCCDTIAGTSDPQLLMASCRTLITETEALLREEQAPNETLNCQTVYQSVYERARIYYQKITDACFAGDHLGALLNAAALQSELDAAAKSAEEAPQLANLVDLFYRKDLTSFAVSVYSHEAGFMGFLLNHGLRFCQYANIERFEEAVLPQTKEASNEVCTAS